MMTTKTKKLPVYPCSNRADHAEHTVRSSVYPHPAREVCPGRHAPVTIQASADPFAGIAGAYDDRDL